MTIKVTYNVTDVYMTQSVSPVYINVSYSDGGSGAAVWGGITGTLSNQTDLQNALNAKFDDPTGTTSQYLRGDGSLATFPAIPSGTVTSVGLSMPSAFAVANSPVTSSGTLAVTATGDTTQYIAGDGSLVAFPITGQAGTLVREVRNNSGATITKGTVVYINGASGNRPTIAKAIATTDATSAQTFGLVQADISNNSNGYIVAFGDLDGLDTSAFTEGAQLYLSATVSGGYTITKQYAPNHLVYIGVVTRSHPNQGRIEVRIQNGYEMDEIHDVSAQSPSNNDGLFYNSTSTLWENKSIATALGYTSANAATTLTINGVTYDLSTSRTWTISAGISGSGTAGQVTYWSGSSAVSGSNNLFWDNAQGRLGIGIATPAVSLDVRRSGANELAYFSNTAVNAGMIIGTQTNLGYLTSISSTSALGFGINGSTTAIRIFTNSNVAINSASDLGVRFGVVGDTLLRGSGATAATIALTVQNSDSSNAFRVLNNGQIAIGNSSSRPSIFTFTTSQGSPTLTGTNLSFYNSTGSASATSGAFTYSGDGFLQTSGNQLFVNITNTFSPTSGTATVASLYLSPIINQTGGANGITRGLYVNPTLTAAADFRAIEWSNNSGWGLYGAGTANNYLAGNLGIGVTPTVRLQVAGDTLLRGSGATSATTALTVQNSSSTNLLTVRNDGLVSVTTNQNAFTYLQVINTTSGTSAVSGLQLESNGGAILQIGKRSTTTTAYKILGGQDGYLYNSVGGDIALLNDFATGQIKFAAGGSSTAHMIIKSNGRINMSSLPTSATGLVAGDLWNNGGVINIV